MRAASAVFPWARCELFMSLGAAGAKERECVEVPIALSSFKYATLRFLSLFLSVCVSLPLSSLSLTGVADT